MKYYPGKRVPRSGIYDERNGLGIRVDQITLIKNHHFPPLLQQGNFYELYLEAPHRTLETMTYIQARKKQIKENRKQTNDS